jgi:hypothetical protein
MAAFFVKKHPAIVKDRVKARSFSGAVGGEKLI